MVFPEANKPEPNRDHARMDGESYSFICVLDLGACALGERSRHVVCERRRTERIARGV
jgi:hypothetical protein